MRDNRVELVRRSWGEVLAWCREHAPATAAVIHGPADEKALTEAQAEMGLAWPEELVAWLRMSDGAGCSLDAGVIPWVFVPLGVEHIVEYWRMLIEVADENVPADRIAAAAAQPAASVSAGFLRAWVPVAANFCGSYLFIDLRRGERRGCVGKFDHDDGFTLPPIYNDIARMLDNIAFGLRTGRWVDPGDPEEDAVPTADDGRLRWEEGPSTVWNRAHHPTLTPQELRDQAFRLAYSGHPDDEVAARLGLSAQQMAELRAEWDAQEEERLAELERENEDIVGGAAGLPGSTVELRVADRPPDERPPADR